MIGLDRRADYADAGAGALLRLLEEPALGDVPVADLRHVVAHPAHAAVPVAVVADELAGDVHRRRDAADEVAELALDRLRVAGGHSLARTHAAPHRALPVAVWEDHHQVVPHRRDLLHHHRRGALADRQHRDNRGDADDDADAGEERARLVAHDGEDRHLEYHSDVHGCVFYHKRRRGLSACRRQASRRSSGSRRGCARRR